MAGGLGVQLGGTNYYDGRAQDRPVMGDGTRTLTSEHVGKSLHIMTTTAVLGLGFAVLSLWLA